MPDPVQPQPLNVLLLRGPSTSAGTFGHIIAGDTVLRSGELPWRDNLPSISCLPPGVYPCTWARMESHNTDRYLLSEPFPSRSGIFIHSAVWCGDRAAGMRCDLLGCIAPALEVGPIWETGAFTDQPGLISSRRALDQLHAAVHAPAPFTLVIIAASDLHLYQPVSEAERRVLAEYHAGQRISPGQRAAPDS